MNSASGSLDAMEGIWNLKYEPQHLKKAGQDGTSGRACPQPNHSHSVYKRAIVVLALESRASAAATKWGPLTSWQQRCKKSTPSVSVSELSSPPTRGCQAVSTKVQILSCKRCRYHQGREEMVGALLGIAPKTRRGRRW